MAKFLADKRYLLHAAQHSTNMKLYTLNRQPDGTLVLSAQAEVIDKDAKGRSIGSHVETETTSGYDIGNASEETQALALAILRHYYGASSADAGAEAEAQRQMKPFLEAFLIHHQMKPGSRFELSSDVLDRFFALR